MGRFDVARPPVEPEEDGISPSRRKADGASATPLFGTWTGFLVTGAEPFGVEERFMNAT
ncbi:hypothetical protein [Brevundimonas subvibrioides]|uniref:hypothetical protein n=1 Tax=Brevundimonas subvibrioides TaxID=74313 RepID=UPI0022B2B993|nr:hypothetical protein [Brevundimonas subvibrioides]